MIKLDIWDTAGQERFRSISSLFYRESGAALIVYDVTDKKSLQMVKDFWLKQIKQYATSSVIIALAGNKCDLMNRREVSEEEAKTFAEENGLIYFETSARTGKNVVEIFTEIASRVPKLVNDNRGDERRGNVGFKLIGKEAPRQLDAVTEKGGCAC